MADASCSGTTPYKQLIDHQNRDVSHHQDRLVDRNRSAGLSHGSFRSSPQPSHSQQEFGAFIDGPSVMPGMSQHAAGRVAIHAAALESAHARPFASQAASPHPSLATHPAATATAPLAAPVSHNWAADFQRYSQRQTQPPPQHSFATPASALTQQQQQLPNFQAAFGMPNGGFQPLYGPTNGGLHDPGAAMAQRPGAEADFDQEMSRWMAEHGRGGGRGVLTDASMREVDAVMEQLELEQREQDSREAAVAAAARERAEAEEDQLRTLTQARDAPLSDLEPPEMANLSLDAAAAQEEQSTAAPQTKQTEQAPAAEKSAVSEAAEKLLETVQHENGDKWKNSVFLSLMRDFRDGRKDIVDNEIRDAAEPVAGVGGVGPIADAAGAAPS